MTPNRSDSHGYNAYYTDPRFLAAHQPQQPASSLLPHSLPQHQAHAFTHHEQQFSLPYRQFSSSGSQASLCSSQSSPSACSSAETTPNYGPIGSAERFQINEFSHISLENVGGRGGGGYPIQRRSASFSSPPPPKREAAKEVKQRR
jgi:hypothetical protein